MTQSPNESLSGPEHTIPPGPDAPPLEAEQHVGSSDPQDQPVPAPGAGPTLPLHGSAEYVQAPAPFAFGGPVEVAKLPARLNPAAWWNGAVVGAGAYVAVLLLSLVTTLMFVIGLAASGSGESISIPKSPLMPDVDLPSPWSFLFQLAAQLPALGMMGSLGGKLGANLGMFGQISATFGVFVMPLLLTVGSAAALFFGARLAEKRQPSVTTLDRVAQALVSGAVFSLLLNLVATVASLRIPLSSDIVFSLNAANFASIAVAFLIGTLASLAGRSKLGALGKSAGRKGFAFSLLRDAGMTTTVHLGVFLVIAIPVAVIVLGVQGGWAATLSAPLWAPTVGLFLLGMGHFAAFGSVSVAGAAGSGMSKSNFGYGVGGALTEFGVPVWAGWLLVLLALIAVVAAATYWYLRRGVKDPANILGWVVLPVTFAVAGALLVWLTGIHANFNMAQGHGAVSIGFAWWTPFLMMLWGAAIEVASRYLAPVLAPLLPAAVVSWIQKSPSMLSYSPKGTGGAPATAAFESPVPTSAQVAEQHAAQPGGTEVPQPGLPAPAASQFVPVMVEAKPLSKKAKRNLLLSGGAIVLVGILVGGGAIVVGAVRGANGPDKVVQDYLGAMVDGNAERALEIADPNISNDSRVLMTNEVYGKATNRPDGFTVLKTTIRDDFATVSAELRQNGAKSQTTYRLAKINPTPLNSNWQLQDVSIGSVVVSADSKVSNVLVNGVSVALEGQNQGSSTFSLRALPGTYNITLPTTSKFLTTEPVTAVVSIQDDVRSRSAKLTTKTNAAFDTAVKEKVSALLTSCAAQTVLKPENCPFYLFGSYDVRNVAWKITTEPTIKTYADDAMSWRLSSPVSGKASVSYERDTSFGSNAPKWESKTDSTSIYIRGTVTVNNDDLTVKFTN